MVVGDDNAKSRINWKRQGRKAAPQEEAPGPADSLHYRVLNDRCCHCLDSRTYVRESGRGGPLASVTLESI